MRRENREPLLEGRDEHDHHPRTRLGAVLLVEGQRRLVAMVPVGNEELRRREVRSLAHPPKAVVRLRPVDLDLGRAVGQLYGRAIVEQEDRLQLRPRGAEQPQSLLLRPGMRPLVREHDGAFVRLERERDDEAVARAADAVRPDVRLRERPCAVLQLAYEHAGLAPGCEVRDGLRVRVGKRQVDDVVGAAREVLAPLLLRDHVVGRRDEVVQRQRVALGAKRADLGHVPTIASASVGP
jgi:hypothetical protein